MEVLWSIEIYRSVNGVYDSSPVATVPSSQSFYQDNIEGLVTNKISGEFCYYIEAVENSNNYGIAETSLSNRTCVNHDPIVYVPNGLFIGGINNTWKPIVSLIDFSSYDLKVVGRQGHIVFSSVMQTKSGMETIKESMSQLMFMFIN